MNHYQIYSAGRFAEGDIKHGVTNKYTGEQYATCSQADEKLLDETIGTALGAKATCANLPVYEKSAALFFIANEMQLQRPHLSTVLATESGKPLRYAEGEIDRAIQTFRIAGEECKRLPKEYMSLDWTPAGKGREGLVKYFPVGIVAGISPFNFPMNLAVHKIAPAIAAGCPIILKPASATPLSTLELAMIIDRSPLPKGAVSILPMDRETGNRLVTDERINMLSFTGSPEIGWSLKKQSGKKKVVLELGGNAGVIVAESADPDSIISRCVAGAFAYSGQICIHAQRFFVHEKHFDKFVSAMKTAADQLVHGDPLTRETDFSVMIDEANAIRVEEWIAEANRQGAKVVTGGKRDGVMVSPTILTNTNPVMKVSSEEVFGPVICIEKYTGEISEAVHKINEGKFGLQCGVFTDSVSELDYCFNHIEAGGIIHNDVSTLRFDHMPYGGVKESGLGREGVKYAIMDMMEARILVK